MARRSRSLAVTETADRWHLRSGSVSSRPLVRLQGAWLDRAGFPAGSRVRVEVEAGKLIVTPEEREE
jgi:hypothetical protein